MSNYQSMTQNPNGLNLPSKYVPSRQFQGAKLAASGNVTQTAFGWHVTDSVKHLVVVTDGLYTCDCGSDSCPHAIAVTIYNTAYTYVKEFETSLLSRFLEELKWNLLPGTDNFERLILQTLANICDDFLNYQKVKATPRPIDPSRNQLEEELSQLFCNIYLLKAPSPRKEHNAGVLWPPRTKPARPTDQDSAALTPYQLHLLIEGTGDPFRKVLVDAHAKIDCQVTRSELVWLYERTTDTFGEEIVDELFSIHLGWHPYHDDFDPTGNQMQELYEAFVDAFGEIDAHLLFADALCLSDSEST